VLGWFTSILEKEYSEREINAYKIFLENLKGRDHLEP
jgi:hypothetical protein